MLGLPLGPHPLLQDTVELNQVRRPRMEEAVGKFPTPPRNLSRRSTKPSWVES